jgi:glucose/arabinose dehydrogenase
MKPVLFALASFALPAFAAETARIKLPPPYQTPSATNAPKVVPQPPGQTLQLPAGFRAELFAEGFQKPRYMIELPGGTVLVTDSVADGTVQAIAPDKSKRVLIRGLDRPFGMAIYRDHLYVSEATAINRYPFNTTTMEAGAGEKIIPLDTYGKGHWTRSIAFDKKGKLYVSIGSASNIDPGDPKDRAAINTYNPDGTGHHVLAGGLRNPVSIRFHPQTGKLWTTVQERDGLGDDLVPDYFTEIKPGAFYGWPFAYLGPNEDPRRKGESPESVNKTIEPDVVLSAHASVMDFAFYTGKSFPARYRNGAFIAYRGSSNRAKRFGYKLVFVPFRNGRPAGPPEDFLTGFMLGEDSREVWGRPVGLLERRDGSLLLSEDGNNKIWKISYAAK